MRTVRVNPTIEITMIGHSEGGAEAVNSVAINTNAIIFNLAIANLSAYELDSNTYIASIVTYVVEGDTLNAIFGGVYTYWRINHVR